jgi:hypothetical protein
MRWLGSKGFFTCWHYDRKERALDEPRTERMRVNGKEGGGGEDIV